MKKSLKIFVLAFFTLFSFGLIGNAITNAEVTETDQFCEDQKITDADNWWKFSAHTLAQTFTPGLNRLNTLDLAVAGNGGPATITADIFKVNGSDSLVATRTATTSFSQVSWLTFNFEQTEIDTSKQHKIVATSTSSTAYWVVSTTGACYSGGTAIVDGSPVSDQDFGFVTSGYNYSPPATPTPLPTNTLTPTPSPSTAPVDASVQKPSLSYIEKNNQKTDAPIKDEVKAVSSDQLKVVGTSFEGAKVTVFVGDLAYSATVDSKGKWVFDVPLSKIKDGSYTVKAQAVNDKGKGSEKVTLFNLKKEDTKATTTPTSKQKTFLQKVFTTYLPYSIGGLILLLAALSGLIYYLVRKRNAKPKIKENEPLSKKTEH